MSQNDPQPEPESPANRLIERLVELYPESSRRKIKSWISDGHVIVNGRRLLSATEEVGEDEEIRIERPPPFFELPRLPCGQIVSSDDKLLVIDKEPGWQTLPDQKERQRTIFFQLQSALRQIRPRESLFVLHRLDRDTSGLLLFGRTRSLSETLQKEWNQRVMLRRYEAVVVGNPGEIGTRQTFVDLLLKDEKTGKMRIFQPEKAKAADLRAANRARQAITDIEVVERGNGLALLRVDIGSGRKNQIRIQLAARGLPIVGEKLYCPFDEDDRVDHDLFERASARLGRLALHASELELQLPDEKEPRRYHSQTSGRFSQLLRERALSEDAENRNGRKKGKGSLLTPASTPRRASKADGGGGRNRRRPSR